MSSKGRGFDGGIEISRSGSSAVVATWNVTSSVVLCGHDGSLVPITVTVCDVVTGCDAVLSPTGVATRNEVCLVGLRPLGYLLAFGSIAVGVGGGGVVSGSSDEFTVFVATFNKTCLLRGHPLRWTISPDFDIFTLSVFLRSVAVSLLIVTPFNVLVCWRVGASCTLWPLILVHLLHGQPLGCTTVPAQCSIVFVSGSMSCFVCACFSLGTGLLWNTFLRENSVFISTWYLVSSFLTNGSGDVAVPISRVFRCDGEVAFSLRLVITVCDISLVTDGCRPTLDFFCLGLYSSSVLLSVPYFAFLKPILDRFSHMTHQIEA